jgi:hypothetical protein
MTTTIEQANAALRTAVQARREAQAAGKPAEQWYGEPAADQLPADDHEHHLHRAGLTQEELDEALERLAGDGISHVQQPGSLPFLELLEDLRTLHLSKSQDYGSENDPLANIRQGAEFVGIEPWRGCMVRVADKVQRLKTYCRTGRLVHEGVRDTLLDLAAYSLLAIVLFDEGSDG